MTAARLTLRRIGSRTGRLIKRPDSWHDLLEQARAFIGSPVSRIFTALGDEVDDIYLLESGDVVYVAGPGECWRPGGVDPSRAAPAASASGLRAGSSRAGPALASLSGFAAEAPTPQAQGLPSVLLTVVLAIGVALTVAWSQGLLPQRRRPGRPVALG